MDKSKIKTHIERISSIIDEHSNSEIRCAIVKTVMSYLSECDTNVIEELLNCTEGLYKYNNFLTEKEARNILKDFKNYDGSSGAPFNFSVIDELEHNNKCVDYAPYYNKYTLYVTMCKFASDQGDIISKLVNNDNNAYIIACYDMSVAQLKDADRPRWVRHYFNLF